MKTAGHEFIKIQMNQFEHGCQISIEATAFEKAQGVRISTKVALYMSLQ